MSDPTPPPDRTGEEIARRLDEIGNVYLEKLQAGEKPDRQVIVSAHPEIADLLAQIVSGPIGLSSERLTIRSPPRLRPGVRPNVRLKASRNALVES